MPSIGLHAFTGCNSTSCFAGKGKLKALKMLEGDQDHQDTFSRIGTLETISGQDMQVIKTFVCQLYGKPSHTSVDKVRYDKVRQCFKGKKGILSNSEGVDLSQMPPCQDVLMLHPQRANFQIKIWRVSSSNFPDLPKPENNRWRLSS
ncbi:DNA damage-inducible protein din7 [Plakobranchus ocellatus]|uniref:DNA damage-inducible protein din7 n=1 Tax=Plakobranchus ocellatus TaxID=259542 RepID=A0AAV3ZH88_9GAST|nr:DNA damage-inducible protein din7 [Plakobranchus ocellatus]